MTRSMLFVGIAVVLGAPGMAARAQEPRPEEIIDRAIRAHGGEEKLTGLSGFTLKERQVLPRRPDLVYPDRRAVPRPLSLGEDDQLGGQVEHDGDRARWRAGLDEDERPRDALSQDLHRELL